MKMPEFLKKIVFCLLARHFVAGETIDDAIRVAKELENEKIYSIINILGEHVKNPMEAMRFRDGYLRLIFGLSRECLFYTHISVKPSQLGVEISKDLYQKHLSEILKTASDYLPNIFVEIDRETHDYAGIVREVSLGLAKKFFNQRLACQLNLNETIDEIEKLREAGISVRLCKGTAYPGDIKKEEEIRKRFLEQATLLTEEGYFPVAATHDLCLIDELKKRKNLGFQVLLGIENGEMKKLAREQKEVGFYIPCGSYWWSYGKRRGQAIFKIWLRNWWYRYCRLMERCYPDCGRHYPPTC